jgi:hypothetical protein
MSDVTNTAPGHFVGWLRKGREPWRPVVTAGDYGGCLQLLLDRCPACPGSRDLFVGADGVDPPGRKAPGVPAAGVGLFEAARGPA